MTTSSLSGRSWQRTPDSGPLAFLKRLSSNPAVMAGLAGLVLILGVTSVFQWTRAEHLRRQLEAVKPPEAQQIDTTALVAEVGRLIALPADEIPTVATVTDPNPLKDQAFFAHAKQGDLVLIYPKAGKAILYDPEAKQILEVGPISGTPQTNPEEHAKNGP